jgi:hypothetical protein
MKKTRKVELDDKDIIRLAKGAGTPLPEGFVDKVLQKARKISAEKAKLRMKMSEK